MVRISQRQKSTKGDFWVRRKTLIRELKLWKVVNHKLKQFTRLFYVRVVGELEFNYGKFVIIKTWGKKPDIVWQNKQKSACIYNEHESQKKAHRWCAFFNEICRCASSEMAAPWNAPMVREISAYADVKRQISFHRERSSLFHNLRQANYFTSSGTRDISL